MTPPPRRNLHATAIVVDRAGILFLGPSGSGKSQTAFACLAEAACEGRFAALVADDQIFVECASGRMLAIAPEVTAGLIELRGSGIVGRPHLAAAVIRLAVALEGGSAGERLPPEGETFVAGPAIRVPLVRLDRSTPAPLAALRALAPAILSAG